MTPHFNDYPRAIFVTNDDRIIGWSVATNSLYITSDIEGSWELLAKVSKDKFRIVPIIGENVNGELYFTNNSIFYKINEGDKSLDIVFEKDYKLISSNFLFLSEKDVAFYGGNEIHLFNLDNGFQYSTEIESDVSSFLSQLSKGPNNMVYVTTIQEMIVFDSLVRSQVDRYPIPQLSTLELHYSGLNNRLYTEFGYSDNGQDWTRYPRRLVGRPLLSKNGYIHIIDNERVNTSSDRGETFSDVCRLELETERKSITLPYGAEGLIINNNYSENRCGEWVDISMELENRAFANNVYAYMKDTIAIYGIGGYEEFMYLSSGENLNKIFVAECKSHITIRNEDFLYDQDGNFYFGFCHSRNNGNSLDEFISPSLTSYDVNKNAFYALANDSDHNLVIHKTEDHGETWETFNGNISGLVSYNQIAVSNSNVLYKGLEYHVNSYTLEGDHLDSIHAFNNNKIVELRNSFIDNKLYIFERDSLSHLFIGIYDEDEKTINYVNAPREFVVDSRFDISNRGQVHVDHNDYIYLQDVEQIWLSQDDGATWHDITPENDNLVEITDLDISWDNYLFVSTIGTPILRSVYPIGVLSSTEEIDQTPFTFYPNPANLELTIDLEDKSKVYTFEVTNAEGLMVSRGNISSSETIPLTDIPSGLYFVAIKSNGAIVGVEKVVVSK